MDADLVSRAYDVFARYPKKVSPTVASWPDDDAMGKRVRSTRLRALNCEDVASVWWNATGSEASVKHFLPRVLECVACGHVSLDDVKRRLGAMAIAAWPEDEQAVVRRVLAAQSR